MAPPAASRRAQGPGRADTAKPLLPSTPFSLPPSGAYGVGLAFLPLGADDAEKDVHQEALARLVDDLAGEEARDEAEDDPGQYRHDVLLTASSRRYTGLSRPQCFSSFLSFDGACAAGAGTLATIYHGCQRYICVFEPERPIAIEHYLSVFARALGIEFEDTYKKYMHMGDPDRILEDASPCMAANGVDPQRARGMVIKTFSA